MIRLPTRIFISSVILIAVSDTNGQIATVEHPGKKNLVIRTAPPFSSPTIYKLSERVCSVGTGTKLRILSKQEIHNGEIWYEVTISQPDIVRPFGCPTDNDTYGWIVGVLKNGYKVVKIDTSTVPADVQSGTKPDTTAIISSEESLESEQKAELDLWSTVFILIGTLAAVVLVQIEKTQSLALKELFTLIVVFRIAVISIANIVFVTLFLGAFMNASLSSMIDVFFKVIGGNNRLGYFLLSFTLSILVQRFITFTKQS